MAPRPRPNIVWISTHDINPHLGCYRGVWPGAEVAVTPHLDALAAEGVRFDQAFATAPVCAPSRSSIMTGCFPTAIGTHHMRSKAVPPPEVRLLSEYFRKEGYYTTNAAFTDFQVEVPGTAYDDCGPDAHWRGRPTEDTPFFAAFHGLATHESQLYLDDDAFATATAGLAPEHRHDPAAVPVPPYHPDSDVYRSTWARYHDLITLMDGWAGRILAQLDADDLTRDTIVVFWSDHGAGFPRAKRWAGEAGLRVPVVVRWPGRITADSVRTDVVHLADLAPSMLRMAGIDVPAHMQASPLFDEAGGFLEQGGYAFGGRDRMDEQHDSTRTVRDERYRYIRHRHPDRSGFQLQHFSEKFATWRELRRLVNDEARSLAAGEEPHALTPLQRRVTAPSKPAEELYDIASDPHETLDLAASSEHAGILARLSLELDAWIDRVGDLGLLPEEELLSLWRPEGQQQVTADPDVVAGPDGLLHVSCETAGAMTAWSSDAPVPMPDRSLQERISGDPLADGRLWTIISGPLEPSEAPRWVRAWRLGYAASADIRI
ncbi:sulfatase [Microbacteriaceae bacterium VKM Ac-2855]|nr:sulfatase [Microbacteriaceae bacterium VKM Ac-2855]